VVWAIVLSTLSGVAAIAAGVYAYAAWRLAQQGTPAQLQAIVKELGERVQKGDGAIVEMRASLVQWITEIEGVLTAVEDALGRVENKRKSTAANLSAIRRAEGNGEGRDPDSLSTAELAQLARERGIY
jgi:hypothetical protein